MLTQIKLSGFRSFKEETVFDIYATNYKMLQDVNVKDGILKGLLFIGGNASGKTNSIRAITFLLEMLFKETSIDAAVNSCLFSLGSMKLEYHFSFDETKIVYSFEMDKKGVILKEDLLLNGECFLRRIGKSATTLLSETQNHNDIDETTLFLRSMYFSTKFASVPCLARWMKYLSNSVVFNAAEKKVITFEASNKLVISNYIETNGVEEINNFFNYFGFNQEIAYETKHRLSEFAVADTKSEKYIYLKRNNLDYWMPMALESLGNQTLLNMLPALLHVVSTECMFIVDEFSSAFHNELEELIIRYFMENAERSQIFFVSHSTNLLKSTLLRPDQIYTIDFSHACGSTIKKFSSVHPRESQNFEKIYLSGMVGGVPNYRG
ncbi:MAG: AAA family ATPase [Clostridia bacterium]|nr:AAA family ATPase [Clostridia bacterium]MBR7111950.1 AAA family ATPase [Clostridia bacterium]